jgi:hypothetical protein
MQCNESALLHHSLEPCQISGRLASAEWTARATRAAGPSGMQGLRRCRKMCLAFNSGLLAVGSL